MTPGRICSKSSLLVMRGSRAWQRAGGLISPLVKGQIRRAQPEEKAMQDVEPSSALKPSPTPQLFPCMNKHVELLSAKAAPLSLPFYSWMGSELLRSRWKDRSRGHKTLSLSFSVTFFFFFCANPLSSSSLVFTALFSLSLACFLSPGF